MKRRAQLRLPFRKRRRGKVGRPPKGERAGVSHLRREELSRHHAVHVTLRTVGERARHAAAARRLRRRGGVPAGAHPLRNAHRPLLDPGQPPAPARRGRGPRLARQGHAGARHPHREDPEPPLRPRRARSGPTATTRTSSRRAARRRTRSATCSATSRGTRESGASARRASPTPAPRCDSSARPRPATARRWPRRAPGCCASGGRCKEGCSRGSERTPCASRAVG